MKNISQFKLSTKRELLFPLPNFLGMSFHSNRFLNLYIPPLSFFIKVSFPFQLSTRFFCNHFDRVNHLAPHCHCFALQISFSPLDHFMHKCYCPFPFQVPPTFSFAIMLSELKKVSLIFINSTLIGKLMILCFKCRALCSYAG